MQLSQDQETAITDFKSWMADGSPHGIFKLKGAAGTGKTSIAIKLINEAGKDDCILCAPTGKAAYRLKLKTGMKTMSCHQLLRYPVEEDENGKPNFVDKMWRDGKRPKLIVVDEASMVDFELSKSLLTFTTSDDLNETPVPILAIGDPFQLPPVQSQHCLLDTRKAGPDGMLTNIHRQAEGSGVLDLAHQIRKGEVTQMATISDGKDARVMDKDLGEFIYNGKGAEMFKKGVKFLARYRKTCAMINAAIRRQLGHMEEDFQVGDVVMTLNNNYDFDVQNGSEFVVVEKRPNGIPNAFEVALKSLEDGTMRYLPYAVFEDLLAAKPIRMEKGMVKITTSYALTVHKSQGSEWEKVFLVNESSSRDTEMDRRRWLYTGITRAKRQVFVLGSRV